MMRQALVALGPKAALPVVLAGGAALALGALFIPQAPPPSGMYRLVLHAPDPGDFYVSAWSEGDVLVAHDARDGKPLTFTRRAEEHDGCNWLGTERLVPIAPRVYHYSYEETILSCRPDAFPFRKTPRNGIVTVEPFDGVGGPTALNAVQEPAKVWNFRDDQEDWAADDVVDVDVEDVADVEDAERQIAQAFRDADDALERANRALEEANQAAQPAGDSSDDDE
jgi:hypothetical protein